MNTENKTKRYEFLMEPSLYKEICKTANRKRISPASIFREGARMYLEKEGKGT